MLSNLSDMFLRSDRVRFKPRSSDYKALFSRLSALLGAHIIILLGALLGAHFVIWQYHALLYKQ